MRRTILIVKPLRREVEARKEVRLSEEMPQMTSVPPGLDGFNGRIHRTLIAGNFKDHINATAGRRFHNQIRFCAIFGLENLRCSHLFGRLQAVL